MPKLDYVRAASAGDADAGELELRPAGVHKPALCQSATGEPRQAGVPGAEFLRMNRPDYVRGAPAGGAEAGELELQPVVLQKLDCARTAPAGAPAPALPEPQPAPLLKHHWRIWTLRRQQQLGATTSGRHA